MLNKLITNLLIKIAESGWVEFYSTLDSLPVQTACNIWILTLEE